MDSAAQTDSFDADARIRRISSWGTPPQAAESLAKRITAQLERSIEQELPAPKPRSTALPTVPEGKLDGAQLEALAAIAPVRSDDPARATYSLGKSYPDLIGGRSPALERATDAIIFPTSGGQVLNTLAWCAENGVAVVPVGGGSSVVGGIEPLAANGGSVIALDTTGICEVGHVDHTARVATFGAGILGPALEQSLASESLTLGHVPQSFMKSTLGGWIAARSAGQQSLAYGKIESMLAAIEVATPSGLVKVDHVPAHAAGPDALQLMLGSEGTLGIITSATMRLAVRPERVRFATFLFPDFPTATLAARTMVQKGLRPATVRVSDSQETAFSLGSAAPGFLPRELTGKVVNKLGFGSGAMTIVIIPGSAAEASATEKGVRRHMKSHGGKSLGPVPAKHWYHGRFNQPYVRDELIARGLIVDTLETAVPWGSVPRVHQRVRAALEGALGLENCMVGCHLSHLYRDGASLYFTFLSRCLDDQHFAVWAAAKAAVADVLADEHAAASHQHGVGTMHADIYRRTTDPLLIAAWQNVRSGLDPAGICNPGKLFALDPQPSVLS